MGRASPALPCRERNFSPFCLSGARKHTTVGVAAVDRARLSSQFGSQPVSNSNSNSTDINNKFLIFLSVTASLFAFGVLTLKKTCPSHDSSVWPVFSLLGQKGRVQTDKYQTQVPPWHVTGI